MVKYKKRPSRYPLADDEDASVLPLHVCHHEGCGRPAEFRAPKDRTLTEYYWFCLEHVKEYNAAWNYFAGMSPDEIADYLEKDVIGQRPTWKLGDLHAGQHMYDDPLGMANEAFSSRTDEQSRKETSAAVKQSEALIRAVAILETEFPLELQKVRASYKRLAKNYHPDSNGGDKQAEEKFKDITEAYRLIMEALKI